MLFALIYVKDRKYILVLPKNAVDFNRKFDGIL